MDKDWINIYIKITVIILLAIAMFYMYSEFKRINDSGQACVNNPLKYTGQVMQDKKVSSASDDLGKDYIHCYISSTPYEATVGDLFV